MQFNQDAALILDEKDNIVGRGSRKNNLYELLAFTAKTNNVAITLWHERFGHTSYAVLKEMQRNYLVHGLPTINEKSNECEACMLGKQHQQPFPHEASYRAKAPLELVHANLCGKMPTIALGGSSYFLLLVDDYSRKMWVYFLHSKEEAFEKFKVWLSLVQNESGKKLKKFRTDRGGEFMSNEFLAFCNEHGIKRQLTTAYTPQQNGVAERHNRTIIEMPRCMLKAKSLPVNIAVYILNQCHIKVVKDMTPQ